MRADFMLITSLLLVATSTAMEQFLSYEAARLSFPEDQGWIHTTACNPARWIDDGWLVQYVEYGHCTPGEGGERDSYRISLEQFAGAPSFYVEWMSYTDGPSTEIVGAAPSAIVASDVQGTDNHFTIAQDAIRYIRDEQIPYVYVDIEPGIPHVNRLEILNDETNRFIWSVDGIVIDEGVPEFPFPTSTAVSVFRAASWQTSSTTHWRYVRAGIMPLAGTMDFTNDSFIDLEDYYLFQWYFLLSGPEIPHSRGWDVGDADDDGDIDLIDFAQFQNLFTSSS